MAEPSLTVERPPTRPARTPALAVGVVGLVLILAAFLVPSPPAATVVTEVRARMGSKADFFRDTEVQNILRRRNFEVVVDNSGSREIPLNNLDRYDFVFPSGQPAADLVMATVQNNGKFADTYVPFVSPIVLGTYRAYAQVLQEAGAATPLNPGSINPLYYKVDVNKFLELIEQRKRWNDIGIQQHGVRNNNLVLAHTPDVCRSNSGGTYQGLLAYAENGSRIPSSENEVATLAAFLRPHYIDQGTPMYDLAAFYLSPDGKQIAPIVVIYEHQYLAHQLRRPIGKPDEDRVLLYPADHFETQPSLIALTDNGRKLAKLLRTDPALRRRAVELGFRVLDGDQATVSPQLNDLLADRKLEVPSRDNDHSRAYLPPLDLFEKLVTAIGGCPR